MCGMAEDELTRVAVESVCTGPDKLYVDCTFGSGGQSSQLLAQLSDKGRVVAFDVDPGSVAKGRQLEGNDRRFQIFQKHFGDLGQVVNEPIAGVLLDLGPSPLQLQDETLGNPLDLRLSIEEGAPACEWLSRTTVLELSGVLQSFDALHDPLLSDRIAAALLQRKEDQLSYTSVSSIAEILALLRPDFAEEHPNLNVQRLTRAMRVFLNKEVPQLEQVLQTAFERLDMHGRCVVVTRHAWELAVVRQFLRGHEEPDAEAARDLSSARLAELYPLLGSEGQQKDYAVRQVSRSIKPSNEDLSEEKDWMLHVLEKVPRDRSMRLASDVGQDRSNLALDASPPSPPPLLPMHVNTIGDLLSRAAALPQEDLDAEKEELSRSIAARKAHLKELGCALSQQKKDPEILGLVKRLRALYCLGEKYQEKVQERCRNRCHVSVLLEESVEETIALGPDKLYIDCTFGRGGHSKLLLSKLSCGGRLKAFDVDQDAVQVGRGIEATDSRFEIFHRPFGELGVAVTEPVAGILLDLGVSSPQLDENSRGFSVKSRKNGPLDLRMNQQVGEPAWKWLETVSAPQLAEVIRSTCYRLEEPLPERIAEAILQRQLERGPYTSTAQLVGLLDEIGESLEVEHPNLRLAHIVFCSIRVYLNREIEQLGQVLEAAFEVLEPFGRCVIICFTRWERAAVRRFLREHEEPCAALAAQFGASPERLAKLYPLLTSGHKTGDFALRQASQARPSEAELKRNQRAKSVAYVLEKVPRCQPVEHGK
ncbi:unnamed protein product [Polarella glacialis]|uniref:Uncharacterized protein n=1 Tax=Polarella glacialis TaxID=89957 RepID=A0A813E6W5_POLGL|nr:unnamed protein product [Polarella glacialis]